MKISILLGTIAAMISLGIYCLSELKGVLNEEDRIVVSMFEAWKKVEGKLYSTPQENLYRLRVFSKNLNWIKELNAQNDGFVASINLFADLSQAEFKAKYTMPQSFIQKLQKGRKSVSKKTQKTKEVTDIPAKVDWRTKGIVTAIKNQGSCGSCWAFSAVGALEGLHAQKTGNLVDYSVQHIVDCTNGMKWGAYGCQGGWMMTAYNYTKQVGIMLDSDYPYTATDNKCGYDPTKPIYKIKNYVNITFEDNDELLHAAAQQTVSVCIDATVLQVYHKGIVGKVCGQYLDHGVLVVGYDETSSGTKFWLVKNSWGKRWGEHGYFRVLRVDGTQRAPCGISELASYPLSLE